MANLESKIRMSALHFAIILIADCVDYRIIGVADQIAADADQASWLSVLLAGLISLAAALLMAKMGAYFPNETFVEYMPRLWGRPLAAVMISLFIVTVGSGFCLNLAGYSQVVKLFMFDRTPVDIIALSMLVLCIYGTLQDWGTILRYIQIIFWLEATIGFSLLSLALLNLKPIYLLPLCPDNWPGVFSGIWPALPLYAGFEIILLAFPFTERGKISIMQAVGLAFLYITVYYVYTMLLTIGALSAEVVKNTPYATFSTIRGVELPGTFIERMENYLLLTWTPIVFDSLVLMLFVIARTAARYFGLKDHRPLVLLFAPLLFIGASLLDRPYAFTVLGQIDNMLLALLSFGIVPLSLVRIWWRRKGVSGHARG